jgi:hypothetical protein
MSYRDRIRHSVCSTRLLHVMFDDEVYGHCVKVLNVEGGSGGPESERLQGGGAAGADQGEGEEGGATDPRPSGIAGLIQSAFQVLGGGGWPAQNRGTVPTA